MSDLDEKLNDLDNTKDSTDEYDAEDIANNKGMAIVCYLNILVLIPILLVKDSKFVRFHSNQGLILCIAYILLSAALNIFARIPLLGLIFNLAWGIVSLICLILSIKGILNVLNGKAKELPITGKYKLLK